MSTILVVDDSESMRLMLSEILAAEDHEILLAENGKIALEIATEKKVDMVITDLNMPCMDGITLIKSLRDMPQYHNICILVLTTETERIMDEVMSAGATGWVAKPFDPLSLANTVDEYTG